MLTAELKTVRVTDPPDQPLEGEVYLVGDEHGVWAIVMLCPCGCGGQVVLDTDRWSYTLGADGALTITPSVQWIAGCRSHFWIREGRVV